MLKTTSPLILVEISEGVSKKERPYCFVKLANPATFENFTVNAVGASMDMGSLQSGDKVIGEFKISERFNNTEVSLKSLVKAG